MLRLVPLRASRPLLFLLTMLLMGTVPVGAHDVGQHMATAAQRWLAALTPAQRSQATFAFDSPERQNWHFVPKDDRRGVALRDMTAPQQQLTYVLLNAALSHHGFSEALTIMSLEQILHDMENKNPIRDPAKYYVSIFGQPSPQGTWGWRVEGHHLSVNMTIRDNQIISTTPAFFGSNPGMVQQGDRQGLTVLAREEESARQLVRSLNASQRQKGILTVEAPSDVITGPGRVPTPLDPQGIPFHELTPEQQRQLQQVMQSHIHRLRAPLAKEYWKKIDAAGWEHVHFAWAGSIDPGQGHYYRIQGPTFILEYDNTQNNANHVHCVWRDMHDDFGADILRKHYAELHNSQPATPQNQLTDSEQRAGWQLLFDGKSWQGWRNYRGTTVSPGWTIQEGAMTRSGDQAGDLVTIEQYDNFELSLEYQISPEGNSGIMFRVTEEENAPWKTGPEVQVQDNLRGHDPQKSGWLYQLYQPTVPNWSLQVRKAAGLGVPDIDSTRPPGEWNQIYLRVSDQQCEVAVNGISYYYFRILSDDWNQRVAASKFASFPQFGRARRGHICLQDHGNRVAFRNIKIRPLKADGTVAKQPIDGQLPLQGTLAFPHLQWENWEGVDDTGKVQPLRPIELTFPRDAPQWNYVATQEGRVYRFENKPDATQATLVLDLSDKVLNYQKGNECGLLGLALHPHFAQNGQLFVNYFAAQESATIVSRFTVSASSGKADPASETVILKVPQPFENHNGGAIEFGPDRFLYIALGDGGDRNDPLLHGQNRSTWLGSILRIDIDKATAERPYAIPADNPFVQDATAQPEIYAYGLRNVWRMAFDRATGDLWAGDVGQDLWEEVNLIERGGNYGWSCREGTHLFGQAEPQSRVIPPVWEYDHQIGKSVTGGRVYRSPRLPELQGHYLYADYVSGKVWALDYDRQQRQVRHNWQIVPGGTPVLAFGEDGNGEVYYLVESAKGESIYQFNRQTSQ